MVGKERVQRFFMAAGITAVSSMAFAATSFAAGPSLFVTNNSSSSVSALAVSENGSLTANGFASVGAARSDTHSIAVSPNGETVYVTNNAAAVSTITTFAVGADGKLTVRGSVKTGSQPVGVAVSPDGRYVYVANNNRLSVDSSISQYVVQQDGQLAPQAQPEVVLMGFAGAQRLVISPNGKNLYVSSDTSGNIARLTIDTAKGTLTAPAAAPTMAGISPLVDMAISPNGQHLYAVGGNQVQHLTVNSDGLLTLGVPLNVGMNASGITISPDAKNLYVTSRGANTISAISLAADGLLLTNGPAVATEKEPIGVAVSPSGRFVYTASYNNGSAGLISTYSVDNGKLTPVGSVSTGQNGAVDLVAAPVVGAVARFDVVSSGAAGSDSVFDASVSAATGAHISSYKWEFGDGQTETTTTPRVAHKFANAGVFAVKLTVADTSGCPAEGSIFTGKSMLCSGLAKSQVSQSVTVAAAPGVVPPVTAKVPTRQCVVPSLSRVSLGVAKKRLSGAGCQLGKVKKPKKNVRHAKRAKLVVISQSRKRGLALVIGTKVDITLGWRVLKKKK